MVLGQVFWKGSGESHCLDASQPMVLELSCLVPMGELEPLRASCSRTPLLSLWPSFPQTSLFALCSRSRGRGALKTVYIFLNHKSNRLSCHTMQIKQKCRNSTPRHEECGILDISKMYTFTVLFYKTGFSRRHFCTLHSLAYLV